MNFRENAMLLLYRSISMLIYCVRYRCAMWWLVPRNGVMKIYAGKKIVTLTEIQQGTCWQIGYGRRRKLGLQRQLSCSRSFYDYTLLHKLSILIFYLHLPGVCSCIYPKSLIVHININNCISYRRRFCRF